MKHPISVSIKPAAAHSSQDGFDPSELSLIGLILVEKGGSRCWSTYTTTERSWTVAKADLPRAARCRKVWAFEVGKPGHRSFWSQRIVSRDGRRVSRLSGVRRDPRACALHIH